MLKIPHQKCPSMNFGPKASQKQLPRHDSQYHLDFHPKHRAIASGVFNLKFILRHFNS